MSSGRCVTNLYDTVSFTVLTWNIDSDTIVLAKEDLSLNDFQALNEALEELRFAENKGARDRLVKDVLRNNADAKVLALAGELSVELKKEQKAHGVHNPNCGELTALEILFMAWLAEEKEDASGTD